MCLYPFAFFADMKRANEKLNKLKEIQKQKELEEEARLEAYAKEKEEDKARRDAFVEGKKVEAQRQQARMRDVVSALCVRVACCDYFLCHNANRTTTAPSTPQTDGA